MNPNLIAAAANVVLFALFASLGWWAGAVVSAVCVVVSLAFAAATS